MPVVKSLPYREGAEKGGITKKSYPLKALSRGSAITMAKSGAVGQTDANSGCRQGAAKGKIAQNYAKSCKEQRLFTKAQKLSGLGLTLALVTSVVTTACSQAVEPSTAGSSASPAGQTAPGAQGATDLAGNTVTTASGLKYQDMKVGNGPSPQPGQHVTVHYTGKLADGTKFDSSVDRNEPFTFVIGQGNVIQGWDEGVMTMKVGGKRHLIIPAHLGYGANGMPPKIPGNATLHFDVELLGVQ